LFYRRAMRSITRARTAAHLAAVIALVVLAGLVSGCSPSEPLVSTVPTSSSSAAPFASDDEALAAAQATYEDFMAVANQIMAEGGVAPERLDALATAKVAMPEKDGLSRLAQRNLRISGKPRVTAAALQAYATESRDGKNIITAYFCVDGSETSVIDSDGRSVVDKSGSNLTAFEVSFDLVDEVPPLLIVSEKTLWEGSGVC
jgi:hypothetical protein